MILSIPGEFDGHLRSFRLPIYGREGLDWLSMSEKSKRGLRRRADEGCHFQHRGPIHFFWKLHRDEKLQRSVAQDIGRRGDIESDDFELGLGPGNARGLHL